MKARRRSNKEQTVRCTWRGSSWNELSKKRPERETLRHGRFELIEAAPSWLWMKEGKEIVNCLLDEQGVSALY